MSHAVLIPNQIAAMNIDAFNRSCVSASDVDNGNIVILSGKSATAGQGEDWTGVVPSTSDGLTGVWVAYEPEIVVTYSGSYAFKGLDPDPRNFYNKAGNVFSIFKPQTGDILTITADGLAGTYVSGTTTHVNATNSTGGLKPVWGSSQTASVFSMKLLAVTYISIPDGSIGTQRVTAYQFEVVGL
jgi:hypothetical protein